LRAAGFLGELFFLFGLAIVWGAPIQSGRQKRTLN
jgi:hypothetical protein